MNFFLRVAMVAFAFVFTGCSTYVTSALKKPLPTEGVPAYGLYAGVTPLKVPDGTPSKTYFDVSINEWKSGKRLVTWRRIIMLRWPDPRGESRFYLDHHPKLAGGMDGGKVWVQLLERYSPHRQWMLEMEKTPDGRFKLVRESGEFMR